jgi:hypothetical protein
LRNSSFLVVPLLFGGPLNVAENTAGLVIVGLESLKSSAAFPGAPNTTPPIIVGGGGDEEEPNCESRQGRSGTGNS